MKIHGYLLKAFSFLFSSRRGEGGLLHVDVGLRGYAFSCLGFPYKLYYLYTLFIIHMEPALS